MSTSDSAKAKMVIDDIQIRKAEKVFLDYRRPIKILPFLISLTCTIFLIIFFGANDFSDATKNDFLFLNSAVLNFTVSSFFVVKNVLNFANCSYNTFSVKICKKINSFSLLDKFNEITCETNFLVYLLFVIFVIPVILFAIALILWFVFDINLSPATNLWEFIKQFAKDVFIFLIFSTAFSYFACIWYPICNKLYKNFGKHKVSLKEVCAMYALYDVVTNSISVDCNTSIVKIKKEIPFEKFMIDEKFNYYRFRI